MHYKKEKDACRQGLDNVRGVERKQDDCQACPFLFYVLSHTYTQLVTGKDAQEPLSVSHRVVFNIKSTSEGMKENQGHHKQNMSCYVKFTRELKKKKHHAR